MGDILLYSLNCEIITPTFNKPFNQKGLAEIRVPSLKGTIRYWYRALFPEINIKNLYKKEVCFFGGAGSNDNDGTSSKITMFLKMKSTDFIGIYEPVPGKKIRTKRGDYREIKSAAVRPGTKFELNIKFYDLDNQEEEMLKSLVKIAITLGGLGQRARRGMGSIAITHENGNEMNPIFDLEDISSLLKSGGIKHKINGKNIELNSKTNANYPFLKEIRLGNELNADSMDSLLEKIGHMKKREKINDYSLGGIHNNRFASPVWVKILRKREMIRPVYSIFNNTVTKKTKQYKNDVDKFINGIEGGSND